MRTGRIRVLERILVVTALLAGSANAGLGQTPAATPANPPASPPVAGVPIDGAADAEGGLPRRRLLEQRVRQRLEQIVQQQLQLTDEQMGRLRQTNQRFAAERRALSDRERQLRGALRQELLPGVTPNQNHVAALADSLFAIQHQRLDATEAEQKEMAGYLTPVQRVKYYGLQDQLRRRLEQIRQRRPGAASGALIAP